MNSLSEELKQPSSAFLYIIPPQLDGMFPSSTTLYSTILLLLTLLMTIQISLCNLEGRRCSVCQNVAVILESASNSSSYSPPSSESRSVFTLIVSSRIVYHEFAILPAFVAVVVAGTSYLASLKAWSSGTNSDWFALLKSKSGRWASFAAVCGV